VALLAFYGMVAAISLSGVMAPGPITALTLARGRRDPLAGLWINIGHAIAETPLILALVAGLGPFLESPAIYRGTSIAGGAVLFWMGVNLIRRRGGGGETAPEDLRGPVLEGAAMTAFNPYWMLWWLTVGAGLIARAQGFSSEERAISPGAIVFGMVALHLACDLAWGTFLSWAAHRSGEGLRAEWWGRIEAGCGAALIAFAAFFLYEGVWAGPG
jgi:threonine/homoserine/homoserine lactone efflux protein